MTSPAHTAVHTILHRPKLTWKVVHARYVEATTHVESDVSLSYSRFLQYVHYHYPGVRRTRTAEYVCDWCVRWMFYSSNPTFQKKKGNLSYWKGVHISMKLLPALIHIFFVKGYSSSSPDQALHQKLIPDTFDDLPDSDDECAILKTDLSLEYKTRVVFR
ncbi:hypothetical protein GQ600_19692 [Phytophthora cactorum]|nr:hypothetical protein GQ600_19692 [Phytophthora cactorum]